MSKSKAFRSVTNLACACAVAIGAVGQVVAGCTLPPPAPADGLGLMELSLSPVAERAQHAGQFTILWGDQEYRPRIPGVYAMKYMMDDRDVDRTHDIAWYLKNHPDWLARKCDGQVAQSIIYSYGYQAPLDITNPQVRAYMLESNLGKILNTGRFDAVSVDNLAAKNSFGRCGVQTASGFRRDFSGAPIDPVYTAALADWMRWLRTRVNAAGLCLAANDYFNHDYPQGFLALARALDIVVDEHGFTRANRPVNLDDAWRVRNATYRALPPAQPLVIIDYPAASLAALTDAGLSWSLANFLLIKSPRTYLDMTTLDGFDKWRDIPALTLRTGDPVGPMRTDRGLYWRRFARVIAIVNPSSTQAGQFDLPAGQWRGLDGQSHQGPVDIAPAHALVLTRAG